jgi:hypothetical protein
MQVSQDGQFLAQKWAFSKNKKNYPPSTGP